MTMSEGSSNQLKTFKRSVTLPRKKGCRKTSSTWKSTNFHASLFHF